MHPAYSVIVFTTASGAGYGLLFWLSIAEILRTAPLNFGPSFSALVVAFALITAGLLSSLLHLGRPERARGAFSQWRSSWLSREGIIAVMTYIPAGLMGLMWLFDFQTSAIKVLAALSSIGAFATVYCTGMIYASLRTIRQWNLGLVPLFYLAVSAATGIILFGLIHALFGDGAEWMSFVALMSLILALITKLAYWNKCDTDKGIYTVAMATGLDGDIRSVDLPHSMPNFVMREMGYSIARKHARKLRTLVLTCLFAIPIIFLGFNFFLGIGTLFLFSLCLISACFGVLIERWLFFAEAEHVSMLYYGLDRA